MGVDLLAGVAALAGIALFMGWHDVMRGMRLKRAVVRSSRSPE